MCFWEVKNMTMHECGQGHNKNKKKNSYSFKIKRTRNFRELSGRQVSFKLGSLKSSHMRYLPQNGFWAPQDFEEGKQNEVKWDFQLMMGFRIRHMAPLLHSGISTFRISVLSECNSDVTRLQLELPKLLFALSQIKMHSSFQLLKLGTTWGSPLHVPDNIFPNLSLKEKQGHHSQIVCIHNSLSFHQAHGKVYIHPTAHISLLLFTLEGMAGNFTICVFCRQQKCRECSLRLCYFFFP